MHQRKLSEDTVHRVIEMAWEDRTPIDAIKKQFSLSEKQIIMLMRKHLRRPVLETGEKGSGKKDQALGVKKQSHFSQSLLSPI